MTSNIGQTPTDTTISNHVHTYLSRPESRRKLLRLATRMTASDAEDALHDGVVQALAARAAFQGQSAVGTWMYRVVANASLMRLRKGRSAGRVHEKMTAEVHNSSWVAGAMQADDPVETLERQHTLAELHGAIDALPVAYRTAVRALLLTEDPAPVVAARLGIEPGALRTRADRARRMLRLALAA